MHHSLTRRQFLRLTSAVAAMPVVSRPVSASLTDRKLDLPESLPVTVKTIITEGLKRDPSSLNTDWFGTMLLHGLLLWSKRGVSEVRPFARAWLEHHLHAKAVSKYSGPRSRTVMAGGVAITTYAGHYGFAFPCYEMAQQFGDHSARQVCLDIGKTILHQATRNRYGIVAHDDHAIFAIPDTCYFVAPPLMMASVLERKNGMVFREQALYQLRTYFDMFLTSDRGLSKTILLEDGLDKTYWTRASGWLLCEKEIDVLPLVNGRPNRRAYAVGWCSYADDFKDLPELEYFCGGINEKTPTAAALWRQGNLLHFGFECAGLINIKGD
jgi:hypothetical protein